MPDGTKVTRSRAAVETVFGNELFDKLRGVDVEPDGVTLWFNEFLLNGKSAPCSETKTPLTLTFDEFEAITRAVTKYRQINAVLETEEA